MRSLITPLGRPLSWWCEGWLPSGKGGQSPTTEKCNINNNQVYYIHNQQPKENMLVKVKEELKDSEARGKWAGRTGLVVKILTSCKAVQFDTGETVKFYHQHLQPINQ